MNPEIKKIGNNTYVMQDKITYIYIVVGSKKVAVIDTAFGNIDIVEAVKSISDLPIVCINTHGHPDHMGGNKQFKSVICHKDDFVNEINLGGDGKTTQWGLVGVEEGDVIDLGDRSLEVISTPGHSPGSMSLLDRKNRLLFSGDTLQTGPVFLFVPLANINDYIASLEKLKKFAPEYDEVYPAHNLAPVDASYIDDLIALSEKIRDGVIEPVSKQLVHEMPCGTYVGNRVSIYY